MRETPQTTSIDRSDRQGSVALVLILAIFLIGAAVASYWLDDEKRSVFILWFLAVLAAMGLVGLLLYAVGILQFAARAARNDLTKQIADSASEGYIALDRDGKVIYANAAYLAFAGASATGDPKTVERLFSGPPEVTEAVYRLAKAAREGRGLVEEIRLAPALSGGGDAGWYKVRVRHVDRDGRPTIVWTVADRTREREKQENVFQELQHAIDYLDHAPAGFLSARADGQIVYLNATLAGWLDLDIAQFGPGGIQLADIVSGDGAALLSGAPGVPGTVSTETIDLDLKRANGRTLPVRLFHRVAYAADGTRGPSRTLVLNRSPGEDVAEGLRAAEVRFARFFNSTPLAIASVNRQGQVVRSNAPFARAFSDQMAQSASAGRSIIAAVAESERAQLIAALNAAHEGHGEIPPLDLTLAGEPQRSARFFISAVEERESDEESAIVYALETTEQQKLQEQFFQAQKMNAIGQLAGGVAHDFNNHLQSILGFSDLLLASHKQTDGSYADIVQIKNSANRAKSLVRQLLAFSRQQTLMPEEIHIGERLSELSNMLKRSIGPKVELDVRYARDLWPVHADPGSFDNMIINLAVNARDAMLPNGGKLTVRTANISAAETRRYDNEQLPEADYALIEVEDNGSGMPPEVLEKIFEPFFTTKEVGRGTGLGLSSAYGFVQQSGGVILCDSTLGTGTTFRIFLPRSVSKAGEAPQPVATAHGEAARIQTQPEAPAPARDLTGQGTIMLVEDEEAVRNFAARALASRGYTVLQAPSGVEGLEIAKGRIHEIDLVVSDVVMPEMDGPTMLGELRKLNPDLKVIFVSGYAEEAFRKNLPEGQQFNFLPKPFSLKQLIETVKTVISE